MNDWFKIIGLEYNCTCESRQLNRNLRTTIDEPFVIVLVPHGFILTLVGYCFNELLVFHKDNSSTLKRIFTRTSKVNRKVSSPNINSG